MTKMIEFDEVEVFLAGTFHQDMNDVSEALEEYFEEVDCEWLIHVSEEIDLFLKSMLPADEKENLIKEWTCIYFPAIGMEPVEWLKTVLEKMRTVIRRKVDCGENMLHKM